MIDPIITIEPPLPCLAILRAAHWPQCHCECCVRATVFK
jgi:hypothetical protein